MKITYILSIIIFITACSGSSDDLTEKKAKLDKLKAELVSLNQKIKELEEDIKAEDPEFLAENSNLTLVSTFPVQFQPFQHKFETRAQVASRRNVQISAEAMGRVNSIYVREGDQVRRGQQLISLDADILQNSIAELKTRLELANTVYEKRERLWKQNIGSEIQYLEAKNQKESLERQLATAQSQLSQFGAWAPFGGVVDKVQAKQGEMAQPGQPLIRLVSVDGMHLEADISEVYLGDLAVGDSVTVFFPNFNQEIQSVITAIGQVINPQNRTFSVEVSLPNSEVPYKPNLVAILKIRDYYQPEALVIPSKLVQQDDQGDYVYLLVEAEEDTKAVKTHIKTGKSYDAQTEVIEGLEAGAIIIDDGHREVTDGAMVQLATRKTF